MKVGFKRGANWYSSIIRAVSVSQFSHGGVWIGDRFYESAARKGDHDKSGVRDYPMTAELEAEYWWIDVGGDDAAALARYEKVKHFGYDYFSLLSFFPVWNVRDASRMYCWEFVLYMLDHKVKWRVTAEIIVTFLLRKYAHLFKIEGTTTRG